MKKLIKITTDDGITHELWALLPAAHDKRLRWKADQDYVDALVAQLDSPDPKAVKEAERALLFLNNYMTAEMGGNFIPLALLGVKITPEFKKEIYSGRNAAQRDLLNCNQGFVEEFTDQTNLKTIGDLHEEHRQSKKLKRRRKKENEIKK